MIDTKRAHRYCKDDISKIENYQEAANSSEQYVLHHRLELTLDGKFAHTKEELMRLDMYYHRPYFELIFLTRAEHSRLHGLNQGEAARRKISHANNGANNPMYGKRHSEESRRKMSEARIARRSAYQQYKSNGGTMSWNEFQASFKVD